MFAKFWDPQNQWFPVSSRKNPPVFGNRNQMKSDISWDDFSLLWDHVHPETDWNPRCWFSPNGPANSNSAPLRPPDWGNDFLDPSWILIIYYRLSWKLTKGTPSNVPPPKSPPQWWRVLSIRDAFKPPQKTCCQCWPIAGGDPPGLFRFSIPLEDI